MLKWIRELLDNTKNTVFVYIIKQLYHSLSSYMNPYIMIGSVSFILEWDIYNISYWLPWRFIDFQRSVLLDLTATRINKQYIREPHQSWYKSVIHLDLGV